jgi:hypothetical protein
MTRPKINYGYLFLQKVIDEHNKPSMSKHNMVLLKKIKTLYEKNIIYEIIIKHSKNEYQESIQGNKKLLMSTMKLIFDLNDDVTVVENLQFMNWCCYPSNLLIQKIEYLYKKSL